jgi:hypothetical protein
MMPALIILTLAWSLAAATNQLHTADYLTSLIQGSISPHLMPALIFVLAAVIAFQQDQVGVQWRFYTRLQSRQHGPCVWQHNLILI